MTKCKYIFQAQELLTSATSSFEADSEFQRNIGQMSMSSEPISRDIHFAEFQCCFYKSTELHMETDLPCEYVMFRFLEQGDVLSKMESWRDFQELHSGRFSVIYAPELKGFSQYVPNQCVSGVGLYVNLQALRYLLEQDPRASVKRLFSGLLDASEPTPFLLHGKMDSAILTLIERLRQSETQGFINGFGRQAMVLELLQKSIDNIINEHCQGSSALRLNIRDIEKLENARKILNQSLQNPPSLVALAHQVGLNDFKLKKGFKQLNQCTVHEYVLRKRLRAAAELLTSSRLPIIEIANRVGYNNHGHFSVAFRKEFGCSPSHYRH